MITAQLPAFGHGCGILQTSLQDPKPLDPTPGADSIEIVAMDGFESAAAEELPLLRRSWILSIVLHLADNARVSTTGSSTIPFTFSAGGPQAPQKEHGMSYARFCPLTPRQQHQILGLFANDG